MNRRPSSATNAEFPETPWTIVALARDGGDEAAAAALESLLAIYWKPVYAYLRRLRNSPQDAEDLTQGLFCDLLSRDFPWEIAPENGRLRSFLLVATRNYVAKDWRKRNSKKRGGGRPPYSLDFAEAERLLNTWAVDRLSPDRVFERQWACDLLDTVFASMERHYHESGRGELFEALKERGVATGSPSTTYAEIARRLGMKEAAVKTAASRLRNRYRKTLREEVARTLAAGEDLESELAYLSRLFEAPSENG